MDMKFIDRTNKHIDNLVEISWSQRDSHLNEILLTRSQTNTDIIKPINDIQEESDLFEGPIPIHLSQATTAQNFDVPQLSSQIIIAVDTGVIHLGEFVGGGIAFAVRGAAYCLINDNIWILRYNTGAILVDNRNMIPLFLYIGKRLGNQELYLDQLDNGKFVLKQGILSTANQVQDRCRNFVERMIQEEAISIMIQNKRGLLLIDGALPAGTYDTPAHYLENMLDTTVRNCINVAGISKKTRIAVAGKPIPSLFDEQPSFVGYMPLMERIRVEREDLIQQGMARSVEGITMGNELFAVRFGLGPPALTFRVDVKNSIRSTPDEVLNEIYSDCQIHGCYPRPLIEAHQQSSFLYQDVCTLLSDLIVRTGVQPKERQSMDWLFAPIGSFGK